MRIRFCRLTVALTILCLSGCASQQIAQPIPPPPDLPPAQIRATQNWAISMPTLPRAVSNYDDVPRAYASSVAQVTQTAPQNAAQNAATPNDLRVMTFNLRVRTILDGLKIWDRRRELVVQRVRTFDPDLLGTQEGLASMEDFLREQLPDYTFFGAGRGDGKEAGEMCGVFFRTTRFDFIEGGHFWLSTTPDRPGSHGWGALVPRMVTWVKLRQRSDGQTFCWFNTHFDAWNARARNESAKLLLAHREQIAGAMPTLITGDFNANEDSGPYKTMLQPRAGETPLVDTFRAVNPERISEEGTMHNFSGKRDGSRIDWILASEPNFQVISCSIDRAKGTVGYPSDHFPVTATLRFTPSTLPIARIE
jgi:endonuclease/exonuclease/phosphatase family metal-dependent hydrolase